MPADAQELGFEEPHTNTRQYAGDQRLHTDAEYLAREHGMAPFDADVFDYEGCAPALFEHTWDGGRNRLSGGPSCYVTGPEGTGKSTLFLRMSAIEMDVNDARVVWRAVTGSRSEWLPYAPIARVCIPKGYEATALLVPKERNRSSMGTEVPLDDVVREVVTYSDVMDLNLNVLGDGMFNVVYPDPEMRGCQWVYEESDRVVASKRSEVEFTGGHDPVDHWWFGWGLSLVERGPFPWTAWMCDEVQSLAPQGAANDKYLTHLKVRLLGESMEDFRKNGIARYFAGHKDKHLHDLIRDRIRWRVCMNGTKNPTKDDKGSIPVGMETVKMNTDHTTEMDIGEGLLYTEQNFEPISWPEISKPVNGDLKVYLNEAGSGRSSTSTEGVSA
jgi:hypothetical protein